MYALEQISVSFLDTDILSLINKQLIYEKLPNDISDRHVLLLDPILGTGLSFSFVLKLQVCGVYCHYIVARADLKEIDIWCCFFSLN